MSLIPPRITIYNLAQAHAALTAAAALKLPVTLISPKANAHNMGAPWFKELVAKAARHTPEVHPITIMDCGDAAGNALGALHVGFKIIRIDLPPAAHARLLDIANQYGAIIDDATAPVLDLSYCKDTATACVTWLSLDPTQSFCQGQIELTNV